MTIQDSERDATGPPDNDRSLPGSEDLRQHRSMPNAEATPGPAAAPVTTEKPQPAGAGGSSPDSQHAAVVDDATVSDRNGSDATGSPVEEPATKSTATTSPMDSAGQGPAGAGQTETRSADVADSAAPEGASRGQGNTTEQADETGSGGAGDQTTVADGESTDQEHVADEKPQEPAADDASSDEAAGSGRQRRELPRIIAVANQKGGVGKTTSTINIGACAAELGFRTLIVDLDPQANATTGLGIDPRSVAQSLYDVIVHQEPIEDCVEPTAIKNLFIVPSGVQLAGAEIELVPMMSREHRLRQAIEHIIDDYDYVLIDCPPSLGLLTVNALTAAQEVLVPIQCEYYALEGLGQLLRNVDLVKANLNPNLDISTIVLVMYDARTKLAGQVVDEVRAHFGVKVCREVIPRTVRLSEAPSYGQPITTFDSGSRGAEAYRAVTKELTDDAS